MHIRICGRYVQADGTKVSKLNEMMFKILNVAYAFETADLVPAIFNVDVHSPKRIPWHFSF